jgi:hypothetical protein
VLQDSALEAIRAIAAALPQHLSVQGLATDALLAGGKAGLAVFYAYLAQAGLVDGADEMANLLLDQAIEAVATTPMRPALYGGFTGVAWATEHLRGYLGNLTGEDVNSAIDEALENYLGQFPRGGEYDLINGVVGLGVYALERLRHGAGMVCLERVIDRLTDLAERQAHGLTWFTSSAKSPLLRQHYPRGHYNVGLAHGVPGVVALCGEACTTGVPMPCARALLGGAVEWVLAQALTAAVDVNDTEGSYFPYAIAPGQRLVPARLAWCYGDPGVAVALLWAARHVGEPAWEHKALAIARQATERSFDAAGVVDASLCHGAAGLGHIFNRLFQATGAECFHAAAARWFKHTLGLRWHDRGIAGFAYWHREHSDGGHWVNAPGILEGAAGIGLALLAAATPVIPAWDRMLLVSVPPHA